MMNTATTSGRDATPDVAASGPTPSGAAKPTRPAGLEEGRDSGYFDSSASNASGSPRLSLSAAPAFMQDGTPPRSLDDEYLADRVNPDKPGDTDYTIGSWGHDNDSDKTALFPEYHPAPFPSESPQWIHRVKDLTLQAILGRKAMARRGKRKARARKIRTTNKIAGPDQPVPMASGVLMPPQPATEAERTHVANAVSESLGSRPQMGPPRPCSCGTPDHSGSSCIFGH